MFEWEEMKSGKRRGCVVSLSLSLYTVPSVFVKNEYNEWINPTICVIIINLCFRYIYDFKKCPV